MGVNTDGEEMGPGSTLTDGVELIAEACEVVQETGNEKSLPQDTDGDVGIQDQEPAKGTGIPLIPFPKVPSQSSALNMEHNKEHADEWDNFLSNTTTTLQSDADIGDGKPELSPIAPAFLDTATSVDGKGIQLEECATPLQLTKVMSFCDHLNTDTDEDRDAMKIEEEIHHSNTRTVRPDSSVNPRIDHMDEAGYTQLYKAALEGDLENVDDLISRGANANKPSKGGLRPLHAAAQGGHRHIVDFLILQGADVNVECEFGLIPLHTAAATGYTCIVESLIAEGANVNKSDAKGWTPFNAAVEYDHLEAVKYLMSAGAKQNRYDGMTPLYAAAQSGRLDIVKFFISNGADVNEEHDERIIPLHGAAARGHLEVMEYLIRQGSDVNKADADGWTPFNAAVQGGHIEAVEYLMTKGVKQNRYDGMTPLYAAAQFGHLDIVKFFISNGADVNEEHDKGMIPLHGAAAEGHLEVMEYLIQQGSDVNKVDIKGCTPFNAAVQGGHLESVKYLMTEGAKQNRYNGMTPLYAAAQSGRLDLVKFFIPNGADVNEEDDEGMILLHCAASRGHLEVMEYLIQQGSDLNKANTEGWTPFNAAVQYGHLEAVKYLITKGVKQNRYGGMTPLYAAAQSGRLDLVKFFISNGADVNEEDDKGKIPLHGAASKGHLEVMDYLILQGSDVNKNNTTGWTPLHAAIEYGHLDVIKYLKTKGVKQISFCGVPLLHCASLFGHLNIVKFFISNGADVNEEDDEGMIPLHGAASRGHLEVIKYLIQQGSDVKKVDIKGWTPFNAAVQNGHLKAVKYLITEGAKQNRYDGMTPLYAAAQHGHLDIVKFFISNGADVNEEDDEGMIPLHGAAAKGHLEVMDYLIHQGSDVNKADAKGCTPFNATVDNGHLEAVRYLMTKGATQNKFDGMTPLYAAAQSGRLDIVKFFISNGADVNEEDDKAMIPLHGAAIDGNVEVMTYLIQHGSDLNKNDNTGWTPLHAAVSNGHLEVVKVLLAKGVQGTMFEGLTLLYIATQYEHVDVVKFLVSSGYDVNEKNECGKSPLHAACYNGNMDIAKFLLHHNANVNEQDHDGWTPLEAAGQEGHRDVEDYLLLNGADMTARDIDGLTPLLAAVIAGQTPAIECIPSRSDGLGEEETGDPRTGSHQNIITGGYVTVTMQSADTHVRTGQLASQVDNAEEWNDCIQADITKRGAGGLSLHNLSTRTHDDDDDDDDKDAANPNVNEHLYQIRGDGNEEDTGDPPSVGYHNDAKHLATRGCAKKKKKVVEMKETDTQSRTRQLTPNVDNANDCTQADGMKIGADELSLKNLPTRIHGDEKGCNGEHNPFIHAKLKYPDNGEKDPMLDQMGAIKCIRTRLRDTIPNNTDYSSPRGSQTWQYSGFDLPNLQTIEADGHPSEESESRCHSLIDKNREMRHSLQESSTSMNAGNDPQINDTSDIDSFPTHPPDVVHQKLHDGNPVSIHGTFSNQVWKTGALVQTFLQMIIALAIILAGSPVLVAGSDSTERVTLQAGKPGMVPFHLPWSPSDTFQGAPYFTFRFESKSRPFCINGQTDIEGFKTPSQLPRFTTSVTDLDTSPCVNLMIDNVDTLDEDGYVLTVVWHSFEDVRREIVKKEIDVHIPPGRAKCFITFSENTDYSYEVHCQATTGSAQTTLSCYQNGREIYVTGDITDNGQITRGIFWLPDDTHFSCCSHDATSHVNETICNDFEWPPDIHDKATAGQLVDTVPTSVSYNNSWPATEHPETTPTPQVESHTGSGACRRVMLPSLWQFTYMFIHLFTFVSLK